MMRFLRFTFVRAAAALTLTILCLWPCSSFYWCSVQTIAPTPQAPDPTTISSPIALASLATLSRIGLDDHFAMLQAVIAPLLAILFYSLLTRLAGGHPSGETFCRRCRTTLRRITLPQCPACGEPL